MTLSGQGLNFTFLLKENGIQNRKAIQSSVNMGGGGGETGLQQQLRSFPISFEMVSLFLTGAAGGCLMQLGVGWEEKLCRDKAERGTLAEMEHYPLTLTREFRESS